MATATTTNSGWRDLLAEGRGARVALISLGVWLNAADTLVTTTIMPTVARDLGGYAYFSWATAAYMVGAILSGATAARLSAQVGLRRAMVAAGLVTAAGCAVSALAPDMVTLVAGRWVQGLGAGWIAGACYAAIGAVFPQRHLARIFGLITGVWGVATVLGPLVGAAFAEGSQWRWLFWFFGAQCLAFVAAARTLLQSDTPAEGRTTPWTQLTLVVAGVALIGAADLVGSLAVAATLCLASLVFFIASVRLGAGASSLFPTDAGRVTTVIGAAYLSFFALTAASMSFSVYAPALLQKLDGFSPMAAGYAVGLESVGWTAAALGLAHLSERWHPLIIRLGAAFVVASLVMLAMATPHGPVGLVLAAALVLGAGFGLTSGFTARRVIAAAPDPEKEIASAGVNSVRQVGSAAGACLAGIVANLFGFSSGAGQVAAEATAFWIFALPAPIALVGAIGCWRVAAARADPV